MTTPRPGRYYLSDLVNSAYGRFEQRNVLDDLGEPVAIATIPLRDDPEGISGNSVRLIPYSGYAGPRWIEFVDAMGCTPKRGTYPAELHTTRDRLTFA